MRINVQLSNSLDCLLVTKTINLSEGQDMEAAIAMAVGAIIFDTPLSPGDTIKIVEE